METIVILFALAVLGFIVWYFFIREKSKPLPAPIPKPVPVDLCDEPAGLNGVGRPTCLKGERDLGGIYLEWEGNVKGGEQDGVFVYRRRGEDSEVLLNLTPLPAGTEAFFDSTVAPEFDYTYRVRSSYKGAWSDYSLPATVEAE